MESERYGVCLSDEEKEAQVNSNAAVKEWQRLISSRWLGQHQLQNVIMARRRPYLADLQEAFGIVQEKLSFEKDELNQLLNFITRFMPSPAEGEKKSRFLEMGPIPSELRLKILDRIAVIKNTPPSLERLLDGHEKATDLLPQDVVRLFETVWSRLCYLHKPDAVSYGTALLLEAKLAPWRGMLPGPSDLFEPLRKVSVKLQRRRMLETSHINQLMWATLRYDPSLQHPHGSDIKWPEAEECLQLYQEMRGNAVQVEMEWERRQEGDARRLFGAGQWQNHISRSNSMLQREKALPVDILPDQVTYELLIRGFAWRGDFQRAASLFDEMTQSDTGTRERMIKLKENKVEAKEKEQPSVYYAATITTFDSFFRGFAKYSIPFNLVFLDTKNPGASEWVALDGKDEQNDWNIHALIDIFEAFLKLDAKACREALEGYRTKAPVKERTWLYEGEVDKEDWSLDLDDSMTQMWDSILSLESPVEIRQTTCPGPTTQQLFFLLTALRRASNDNAQWVLSQWQRVADKFGSVKPQSMDSQRDALGIQGESTLNKEGWTGWKLNNRLVRVLEHLKSKL